MINMDNSEKNVQPVKPASHKAVRDMVYTAMFAALICVCSVISIPVGPVHVTLQTFAICLTAALLGWKKGTLSLIIYILIGCLGLPVFSGKGGPEVLVGMTGGYIFGFVFTALIVGFAADKFGRGPVSVAVSSAIGIIVCYCFGTPWFMFVTHTDAAYAISVCVLPFLIPDAVKIAVVTVLVGRLHKLLKL